jgi:hypothetical protein
MGGRPSCARATHDAPSSTAKRLDAPPLALVYQRQRLKQPKRLSDSMPYPQKRRDQLTAEEAAQRDLDMAQFNEAVTYGNVFEETGRKGTVTFPWNPHKHGENQGGYEAFMDHQIIGAHKVVEKNYDVEYTQRKGTGFIALYAPGTGKTVYSMAVWAAIDVACVPPHIDGKSLFVVPLNTFSQWKATMLKWLDPSVNFNSDEEKARRGNGFLFAEKHQHLTAEAIANAKIILTTPSALSSAYRTFMKLHYVNRQYKTGRKYKQREWRRRPNTDVHPFFRYMRRWRNGVPAFSLVITDELPNYCNPRSCQGQIVTECCENTVYSIPLSGTPGRARPRQMADLARAAQLRPAYFWDVKAWHVKGYKDKAVRRNTVIAFHDELVDRVTEDVVMMPELVRRGINFAPKIGLKADGTFSREHLDYCNGYLEAAQNGGVALAAGAAEGDADYRRKLEGIMWRGIAKMANFVSDSTLGLRMGSGFDDDPVGAYREALEMPSNQTELVYRMARHHQAHGAKRIVIYSLSKKMLHILKHYFLKHGGCGKLCRYMGGQSQRAWDKSLQTFLSAPKSILFMSKAGAVGTNIAPGCHTIFLVGDLPYNNTCLDQAIARIRRCNQPAGTKIEAWFFQPRDSIISKKMEQHVDKRVRLEQALNSANFDNFTEDVDGGKELWRRSASLVHGLKKAIVDEGPNQGDYPELDDVAAMRTNYDHARRTALARGEAPPPKPDELDDRDTYPNALAKDMVLPPPIFPVDGFVPVEDDAIDNPSDSEDDCEILEGHRAQPVAGKRKRTMKKTSKKRKRLSAAERKALKEQQTEKMKQQLFGRLSQNVAMDANAARDDESDCSRDSEDEEYNSEEESAADSDSGGEESETDIEAEEGDEDDQ